jgi:hypothetical protein
VLRNNLKKAQRVPVDIAALAGIVTSQAVPGPKHAVFQEPVRRSAVDLDHNKSPSIETVEES